MLSSFSRYAPFAERTFALRNFNEHETEINQHYWSFKVVSEYSGYLARKKKSIDPSYSTATLFVASGPDAGRIPPTVSAWLTARGELENWLRLSAVVSALSYLEAYLRQVIRSALMSDPLSRFGFNRAVDGVILLKAGQEINFDEDIEKITRGDWASRSKRFQSMFGSIPPILLQNIQKLEQMRKFRNEFAHGFGRRLDVPDPVSISRGVSGRVSQNTLITDLGVLSRIAADIDRLLLQNSIGNFELIYFYHQWKIKPRSIDDAKYSPHRALQRAFNRDAHLSVNAQFCRELIDYYENV